MDNYADRLIFAIKSKGNPCIVGLDPRIDQMPLFITRDAVIRYGNTEDKTGIYVEYMISIENYLIFK